MYDMWQALAESYITASTIIYLACHMRALNGLDADPVLELNTIKTAGPSDYDIILLRKFPVYQKNSGSIYIGITIFIAIMHRSSC